MSRKTHLNKENILQDERHIHTYNFKKVNLIYKSSMNISIVLTKHQSLGLFVKLLVSECSEELSLDPTAPYLV